MSFSEEDRCPRCGARIPGDSPEKLCPACLISGAVERSGAESRTLSIVTGAPRSFQAPAEFPCEFGGYRLLGMLGSGGMGTVYEAEQLATGRRVALKTLGRHIDSPEMQQRFLREGRLAAGVSHPNSLYVFGSEEIDGVPVISMEIAGSGTLKDILEKRGPLPVKEAVDAILDVISGLESVYSGGVLHRDIKPSNCFVCGDGSVKVGDFGLSISTLARSDTFVTAHGEILGTPAYASPEQLRGDTLDVRADIYSVGATLFTLLTNRAPFEGDNAVQVVANAVHGKPKPLAELRPEVPPGLERVVMRCLAKEPEGRYPDYMALRKALLPFSSREPEPASIKVRASAGWIDYLLAFLVPYVVLMISVGGEELLIRPVVERTLYSARFYLALFGFGFLYFTLVEGIWGAGLGKRLKGLRVVRTNGRRPGILRALIRILVPVLSAEGVRIPLTMAFIPDAAMTGPQIALFVGAAVGCGWIPVLLSLTARPANGFATAWDLASGTRVIHEPTGSARPAIEAAAGPEIPVAGKGSLGPYEVTGEMVPGRWIVAADPVLRRTVWLWRRDSEEPSRARRNVARPGRLRWLQRVQAAETTWDAFEAVQGVPFSILVEGRKRVPWSSLRYWLYDLASELWDATGDKTLPAESSPDHVWITDRGSAVLLEEPWAGSKTPSTPIPVGDLDGQQRFLNSVAACVDTTSLPLHARPVLQNLEKGKFERVSFLAGILRGLLDRPAEVSKGIRAGSVFMLPLYVWILVFVGYYQGGGRPREVWGDPLVWIVLGTAMLVLAASALVQLLEVPFRTTFSQSIFRLAVVDAGGGPARVLDLLLRWAIVWLPLLLPMTVLGLLLLRSDTFPALFPATALLLLWLGGAVYAVIHPNRGLQDRFAGTRVVRR